MKTNTLGIVLALAVGVAAGVAGMQWFGATQEGASVPEATPVIRPVVNGASAPASKARGTPVEVAAVARVALPRGISAVGTLRSKDSVMLRPEVTGRISEINFVEGGKVKAGQVLIRLDDSVVRAQLQQAQANLSLANSQHHRAIELSKQGFISKQARDEASSQLRVQQAAAALAKAHLEKTAIQAPFDGLIGLRNVSVGDYVSPGVDLVPLESIDPLQVDFRVPEQFLGQVQPGLRLTVSFDALPGQTREGVVGAISPLIDVGGRSILLRANIANADATLRPGMFARVQLQFSDDKALVIPETALAPAGELQYVFRVNKGHVERVQVKTGQRRGGFVEVVDGLQESEQVVVSGLQKISDGAAVDIRSTMNAPNPTLAPAPQSSPTPAPNA